MVDMAAPTVKMRVLQGQIPTFIATGHTRTARTHTGIVQNAREALRDGVAVRKTNFIHYVAHPNFAHRSRE